MGEALSGHPPGKPRKVGKFDLSGKLGKVGEIVACLWCAVAVVLVAN